MRDTDRAAVGSGLVDALHGQHVVDTGVQSHLVHDGNTGLLRAGVQMKNTHSRQRVCGGVGSGRGGAVAGRAGASSPAVQLLHLWTQVAGRHHVNLPVDAVFGHQGVEGGRQQAGGRQEVDREGAVGGDILAPVTGLSGLRCCLSLAC